MSTVIATLVTKLVTDASGAKAGAAEGAASLKQWVAEQKKVQQAANETRDVLKKAFAAETLVASLGQVSQAFKGLESSAGVAAGQMAQLGGSLIQGFGQGGALGFAIAGISAGVRAVVDEYGAMEKSAKEASDAAVAGHRAAAAAIAEQVKATAGLVREMAAAANVAGTGRSVQAGLVDINLGAAKSEFTSAADSVRRLTSQVAALSAEYDRLQKLADTTGQRGFARQAEAVAAQLATARGSLSMETDRKGKAGASIDTLTAQSIALAGNPEVDRLNRAFEAQKARAEEFRKQLAQARGSSEDAARWDYFTRQSQGIKAAGADSGMGGLPPPVFAGLEALAEEAARADRALRNHEAAQADLTRVTREFADAQGQAADAAAIAEFEFSQLSAASQAARAAGGGLAGAGAAVGSAVMGTAGGQKGVAVMQGIGELATGNIAGGAVTILAESKQFAAIMDKVGGVFQNVADSFGAILEPLAPLIDIIGVLGQAVLPAVVGVFKILDPVFWLLFETVKIIGGGLAVGIAEVEYGFKAAINWILGGIADFLSWMFGEDDSWTQSVRSSMFDIPATLDEAVAAAKKPFEDMTYGGSLDRFRNSLDDSAAAADKVTGSLLNLPAGFKVAAGRFDASDATPAGSTRKGTKAKAGAYAPESTGPVTVNIYTKADAKDVVREVERWIQRRTLVGSGSAA